MVSQLALRPPFRGRCGRGGTGFSSFNLCPLYTFLRGARAPRARAVPAALTVAPCCSRPRVVAALGSLSRLASAVASSRPEPAAADGIRTAGTGEPARNRKIPVGETPRGTGAVRPAELSDRLARRNRGRSLARFECSRLRSAVAPGNPRRPEKEEPGGSANGAHGFAPKTPRGTGVICPTRRRPSSRLGPLRSDVRGPAPKKARGTLHTSDWNDARSGVSSSPKNPPRDRPHRRPTFSVLAPKKPLTAGHAKQRPAQRLAPLHAPRP